MFHDDPIKSKDKNLDTRLSIYVIKSITEHHLVFFWGLRIKHGFAQAFLSRMEDDLQVEQARSRICELFRGAGLPVYRTIQDATLAIHKILEWRRWRKGPS